MKKVIILALILLCLGACKTKGNSSNSSISKEVQAVIDSGNYQILDVRTDMEYNEGHLVGAINVPYAEIDENINLDKDKAVLVYCASGRRSSIAMETLTLLGYEVYNLGGFEDIDLPKE